VGCGLGILEVILLLGMLVPNFAHPPSEPDAHATCINNLRQIDNAKQQWALEHQAPLSAIPIWHNIRRYLGRGTDGPIPKCRAGGVYTIGALSNTPTCSIKGHVLE
jgi:hypothetical protein